MAATHRMFGRSFHARAADSTLRLEALEPRLLLSASLTETEPADADLLGSTDVGPLSGGDDSYEENDSRLAAYDLSTYEKTSLADISGLGVQSDDDWYEIDITSGWERLVVHLAYEQAEGDIAISVWDSGGSWWVGSNGTTGHELIDTIVSSSGTYYLKVSGDNAGNSYELIWDDIAPGSDDVYEANDSRAAAYNLSGDEGTWLSSVDGPGVQSDEDWYQIYVSSGFERVLTDCAFNDSDGDIDLRLYDSGGSLLVSSVSTTDNEHIDYTVAGSGTYYLRVTGGSGNAYDLWWDDIADVDLGGSFFNAIQEPLYAGDSFDLEFRVSNYGANSSGSFTVDFYVSANTFISTGDYYLDSYSVSSISGGDTSGILTDVLTLPALGDPFWLGDADYTIGMIVDSADAVDETDEGNNSNVAEYSDWDAVPIYEDAYEANDAKAAAYNLSGVERIWLSDFKGLAAQGNDDWYEIYASADFQRIQVDCSFTHADGDIGIALYDSGGTFLTSSNGTANSESIDYVVAAASDSYYIRVFGDNAGNVYNLWWDDAAALDLKGTAFNATPEPLVAGESFSVNYVIANEEPNPSGGFQVYFYLSTNDFISPSDELLGNAYIAAGVAGNSDTGTLSETLTLPSIGHSFWQGDANYYIGMIVDATYAINETDEGNNCNTGEMSDWDTVAIYDDAYEENDTRPAYYDLSSQEQNWLASIDGYGAQTDEDWYRIFPDTGYGRILVECTFTHADGDINVSLHDSAGTWLAGASSSDDNEYLDFVVPADANDYYLRVTGADAGNAYDLWWDDVAPGPDELLWGLNAADAIFVRQGLTPAWTTGTEWQQIAGKLEQVSCGEGVLWGVNSGGGIFLREGMDRDNPVGTSWNQLSGNLAHVSTGEVGLVWGLNSNDGIFVREGVTEGTPQGTGWARVSGKLEYVSVGEGSVWGLNSNGGIFVRDDVTPATPTGTGWTRVAGKLAQVSVGDTGLVWGLNSNGGIFVRDGVTQANPAGTGWTRVSGKLAHVACGFGGVWGVNGSGGIFCRTGVASSTTPEGTGWERCSGTLRLVSVGMEEPDDAGTPTSSSLLAEMELLYQDPVTAGLTEDEDQQSTWQRGV
ncbi:MAG: tectonin domain-containing protein [Candidatus Brocadiia bacterium]